MADVCEPADPGPIAPDGRAIDDTVALLAAIAHPVRLLVLVALRRGGPQSVGELRALADVEQSAMSHQLRILREARLVEADRNGKQVVYRLHDAHVAHIVEDALRHVGESR
jgi:DNA-binding transcriptional ArsR family regulator